jgi:hypothetical protein
MKQVRVTEVKRGDVVRVTPEDRKVLVRSVEKVGSFIQIRAYGTTDRWYVHPSQTVEQEPLTFTVDELVCSD